MEYWSTPTQPTSHRGECWKTTGSSSLLPDQFSPSRATSRWPSTGCPPSGTLRDKQLAPELCDTHGFRMLSVVLVPMVPIPGITTSGTTCAWADPVSGHRWAADVWPSLGRSRRLGMTASTGPAVITRAGSMRTTLSGQVRSSANAPNRRQRCPTLRYLELFFSCLLCNRGGVFAPGVDALSRAVSSRH